jgi:phage terminase large subunit-like protein
VSRPTKPGTRKLSDVARHIVVPSGIVSTGYPAVQAKCRDLGIEHDDWQQGLGRLILGKRKDGKYAATIGGVVISIPRQVGKTFTIGSIIFALCILFPNMKVLWTAHRTRTTNETFRSMQAMARRKKIAPHIQYVRAANGEQEIAFRNGSRILFGAREQGFGRGFAEVDVEVFDEAQILTERALEDMIAATNQAQHPAGALLFYMGTPPRPSDPGDAFRNKRAKALAGATTDTVYVELSADPNADPDDRAQWAKGNPSFPRRTPIESMLRLRENVGSDERIWDEQQTGSVISAEVWNALADRHSGIIGRVKLAIDVAPDRGTAAIAGAGANMGKLDGPWAPDVLMDGRIHVELADYRTGTDWIVGRAVAIAKKAGTSTVALDAAGPAGSLIPALEAAGLEVVKLGAREIAGACGAFYDDAINDKLRHVGDETLNAAVAAGVKRPLGEAWAWSRKKPTADICPLVAVTIARYAHSLDDNIDLSEFVW